MGWRLENANITELVSGFLERPGYMCDSIFDWMALDGRRHFE
jgi:hypothetical protein